ncbi:MFS general substrate transporter, partial [Mytilinidion resinicola]
PKDPLNWTWTKKHLVFASLLLPSFLADFGTTYSTVAFQAQSVTYKMTVPAVANSISGGIFMQGPGGPIAVPFTQRYGRLPVLFWSQVLTCAMVVGAALSPTYASFTAFRTLQGLFNTPPQVIGLTFVYDMFFFHERARKINIWAFCVILGPCIGPFVSSLLLTKLGWRQDFGIMAALYFLSQVIVITFGDETLYNRSHPEPRPSKGVWSRIKLLTGIHGAQQAGRPTLVRVIKDIALVHTRPHIVLTTTGFMMIIFMWGIGVFTTIPQFLAMPPYSFTNLQTGLMYLSPALGAIFGEIWGHWFNDFNALLYIKHHWARTVPKTGYGASTSAPSSARRL